MTAATLRVAHGRAPRGNVIVCVAGNPSVDKVFEVDRILPGSIHRPLGFVQVPGGKGVNVARAAFALGAEVMVTGILAGHSGRWVEQAVRELRVPARWAWAEGETRASLSVFDRVTRRLTEFYEAGTPITAGEWAGLERVTGTVLKRATWMTISGSLPPGAPEEGYGHLVEAGHRLGVKAAVDARGESLRSALAAGPDLVKINRWEADEVLGSDPTSPAEALEAAAELRGRIGGRGHAAAITLGRDGAVLLDPSGRAWMGPAVSAGPYPVGSGDAFLAGLAVTLERGAEWDGAMRLALAAAAANAELAGAGLLDPVRAAELAASATVRPFAGA